MEGTRIVEIGLLGGFTVRVDGEAVDGPWRLRKAKALVKLLALAPAHRLHRDVLIDRLWPDADFAAGANNLHQAMHAARRVLGATRLAIRDELVVLGPDGDVVVDVDVFTDAATGAGRDDSIEELSAALALWTGDLLPEDLYDDASAPHRDRLTALRVTVVMRLVDALLAEGDADGAVAVAELIAIERPLDEDVHRALLTALTGAGKRAEAVTTYERLRERLEEEHGVGPTRETRDLYRRLFAGGTPADATVAHNLPAFATGFVGRGRELRELNATFDRTPLLTLIGPGGSGKTRLALELAARRLDPEVHPDGVRLVELAGITEPDLVGSAVATGVGLVLPEGQSSTEALVDQLAGRRLLLVLDNCEHLLDPVVALVSVLLARCGDLAILATSREPLGLPGEIAWRVPSLELPAVDDESLDAIRALESVQLFVERARNVSPSFECDATTAPFVARICRRLDGMPLALELAAARLSFLSVAEVDERLDDALSVLTTKSRGHLDRQQTLAATLDWSHQLLADDECVAFRRLAVCAGGFDLDTAHHLCEVDDIVDVIGRLVDKSLVMADPSGARARYRLHEVVRQYAESRLSEAGELESQRQRHREWFAEQADRHDPDRGQPVALEPSTWFDAEQDNLRAALSSATRDDSSVALRLAVSTWRFWMSRGQIADALNWLTAALDGCPEISPLRARALFATGVLHVRTAQTSRLPGIGEQIVEVAERTGTDVDVESARIEQAIFDLMAHEWERSRALAAETESRADLDPTVAVSSHHFAGLLALAVGDLVTAASRFDAARVALDLVPVSTPPFFTTITVCWVVDDRGPVPLAVGEDSMLLGRRVGAEQARGHVAAASAVVERLSGHFDEALALLDDAQQRFAAMEDIYGHAYVVGQRGHTLRFAGDLEGAVSSLDEAEILRSSVRDLRAVAMASAGRSYVEALLGHTAEARNGIGAMVERMRRTGDRPGVVLTLHNAALIEFAAGEVGLALERLEGSMGFGQAVPVHVTGWQQFMLAHLRFLLGEDEASEAASQAAQASFERLGDRRGLRALQRACKDDYVIMRASD